jgi:uncharacterized cupredoxin-like copper-binding protein
MKIHTHAAGALLALAVAACGGSAATPSAPGASTGAPPASATTASAAASATAATPITERDFKFDTPDVTVAGSPVSLAVTNAGPTIHDLTIRDASGTVLGETEDLKTGASQTITVDLPVGAYTIFCSLPGHESLGLKGTLTVTK